MNPLEKASPKTEIPLKEIILSDKITYEVLHPTYGRAEFEICIAFRRNYLREVFLYRKQQNKQDGFHLNLEKILKPSRINAFDISSWSHKTETPHIWRQIWCKEHKAICFMTYVPDGTNHIEFEFHFGTDLTIRFV